MFFIICLYLCFLYLYFIFIFYIYVFNIYVLYLHFTFILCYAKYFKIAKNICVNKFIYRNHFMLINNI